MTIYVGSRYENDTVDRVRTPSGEHIPTVYHSDPPDFQVFGYGVHVAQIGDRFDRLAAEHLGDPELYWAIANANPELFYPDEIPPGTVLRIPRVRILG